MFLDLGALEQCAQHLDFKMNRRSPDRLDVTLCEDAIPTFKNLPDENDNAFGFESTPWHTHDMLYLVSNNGETRNCGPEGIALLNRCCVHRKRRGRASGSASL